MKYIIKGGTRLSGTVEVGSAKNCVLVLLASTVLAEGVSTIHNVDKIEDVVVMLDILTSIGCKVSWQGTSVCVDTSTIHTTTIPTVLASKLRGSIFLLGALLARFHTANTCMPGGCAIGSRPIDIHINGLQRLGVTVDIFDNFVNCRADDIVGNEVVFSMPSVGATENIVMCAVLAKGKTTIHNCACEPEVVALMKNLQLMGADISGIGTSTVTVVGVEKLHPIEMIPITDRIVGATYVVAVAMTKGDVVVNNCNVQYLQSLISILQQCGVDVITKNNAVRIKSNIAYRSLGNIVTGPYPAFATDMQSLVLSMATIAKGVTTIKETMFENRLQANCNQLAKLGADIVVSDNTATVVGKEMLIGNTVKCTDLRGGASLVLAGLVADGVTVVEDIQHIKRGYYQLEGYLNSLGATISIE